MSLAGRTRGKLDALARDITAASGNAADIAEVDALDEQAVQRHPGRLAGQAGRLDICFNAAGDQAKLGTPLMELHGPARPWPRTGLGPASATAQAAPTPRSCPLAVDRPGPPRTWHEVQAAGWHRCAPRRCCSRQPD